MSGQTVPKEFNDANIRVAREFKAERNDLLKANQLLQSLIGNRDKEVDRLREALKFIADVQEPFLESTAYLMWHKAREALALSPADRGTP